MREINENYNRFKDNYRPIEFVKLSNGKYYYVYEVSFSNLTELYETLKSRPLINDMIFKRIESYNGIQQIAGKPYPEALEDLVNLKEKNYSDFMDLIESLNFVGIRNSYTKEKIKAPTGGYLSVPLYTAGDPLPYVMTKRVKKPDVITIHAGLGYHAYTKKEQVFNRAIILISIINALEKKGHKVELTAAELTYNEHQGPGEVIKISIDIKKSERELDFNTLYKTLCPVEFLRRIVFRIKETIPVTFERWNNNYGVVCSPDMVRELLELNDKVIYFGQPNELGIEGKDIEQDFERCLNSLNLGDRISVKEITDDYKERVKRMIRG